MRSLVATALLALVSTGANAVTTTYTRSFSPVLGVDGSAYSIGVFLWPDLTISDVDVTIDITKCSSVDSSGNCTGGNNAYLNEMMFLLRGPSGTWVPLVLWGTYLSGYSGQRHQLTFDDEASTPVGGPVLNTGTYRPVSPLSALYGESSQGQWLLYFIDTNAGNPLTLNGFSLEITGSDAAAPLPSADVPLPAGLPLMAGGLALGGALLRRGRGG